MLNEKYRRKLWYLLATKELINEETVLDLSDFNAVQRKWLVRS